MRFLILFISIILIHTNGFSIQGKSPLHLRAENRNIIDKNHIFHANDMAPTVTIDKVHKFTEEDRSNITTNQTISTIDERESLSGILWLTALFSGFLFILCIPKLLTILRAYRELKLPESIKIDQANKQYR